MVRTILSVFACVSWLCVTGLAYGNFNDPMKPEDVSYSALKQGLSMDRVTELKLSLILINGDVRRAIINGGLKKVGDSVQGCKVTQINKDNVVLIKNGRLQTLYLLGSHGR